VSELASPSKKPASPASSDMYSRWQANEAREEQGPAVNKLSCRLGRIGHVVQ
jgi:hypothetical protein